jgi:hypothetical protein
MAEGQKERGGGLSLQTLLISSAAAVAAATIVPLIWEQGTLLATAMTPIIVALVSEGLRKPVERVSTVAPRVARRTGTGAALRRFDPDAARTRDPERVGARGEGPERFEPPPRSRRDDPYGLRRAERRRPRLRIALVTGALGFIAAAAVVTASELTLFDGSVSGERGRTTLFGGERRQAANDDRDRARSGDDRDASPTATPEETETPEPTPTPTTEPEATPTPSVTPAPTEAAPTPTPTP